MCRSARKVSELCDIIGIGSDEDDDYHEALEADLFWRD